jgi:hypothetical protein
VILLWVLIALGLCIVTSLVFIVRTVPHGELSAAPIFGVMAVFAPFPALTIYLRWRGRCLQMAYSTRVIGPAVSHFYPDLTYEPKGRIDPDALSHGALFPREHQTTAHLVRGDTKHGALAFA